VAATAIPAAIDALHAAVSAAAAAAGETAQVVDGQPAGAPPPDVIVVGFTPDNKVASSTLAQGNLAGAADEFVSITCLASSWRGGSGPLKPVRDRAAALLEFVGDVCDTNPTLGGVVVQASLGPDVAMDQYRSTDGPAVTFEFTVSVRARLS
jgi:hypothetical protein